MVFTKQLSVFEKLEFVEKMFNELGLAFSEVTTDRALTIYREVVEQNEAVKDHLKFANQKDKYFNNAIDTLKLEFPNATSVTKGNEWVRTYNLRDNVDVITVALKDGSYIQYDVNNSSGEIKIRKVHDMSVEKLTLKDKAHNLKRRLG